MKSIRRWRLTALILGVVIACLAGARFGNLAPARADDTKGQANNQLTEAEKQAGWKLLFDGTDMKGWSNFKKADIRPGWQVKDGTLACVDPHNAGDLVTADKYDWFELSIEYNISVGGNSGILFHVTNDGGATWATGPEIQLEDNVKAGDPERCGWLYQLYKPAIDPMTNKPIDATKAAGEWNQIRVIIAPSPDKSEVSVNGVKYYDFVYGSDDFKARIAKSKFRRMAGFAKSDSGFIALQGDHGSIAFRNIKIRPISK
jgi:3-keto-disaccharide hydrolase